MEEFGTLSTVSLVTPYWTIICGRESVRNSWLAPGFAYLVAHDAAGRALEKE